MSNICEEKMEMPAQHERNVFGQFDQHVKKLERALGVAVISRDGQLKILGPEKSCRQAAKIFGETPLQSKISITSWPWRRRKRPPPCQR